MELASRKDRVRIRAESGKTPAGLRLLKFRGSLTSISSSSMQGGVGFGPLATGSPVEFLRKADPSGARQDQTPLQEEPVLIEIIAA